MLECWDYQCIKGLRKQNDDMDDRFVNKQNWIHLLQLWTFKKFITLSNFSLLKTNSNFSQTF